MKIFWDRNSKHKKAKTPLIGIVVLSLVLSLAPVNLQPFAYGETAAVPPPPEETFLKPVTVQETVPDGYTPIYSYDELCNIQYNLSGKYILMADLVLASVWADGSYYYSKEWTPIGSDSQPFTGILDGNGHYIFGLRDQTQINNETELGLFVAIDGGGTVKNLALAQTNFEHVTSEFFTGGGIATHLGNGTIDNCFVTGSIEIAEGTAGGIVGTTGSGSVISYCANYSYVECAGHAAGIAATLADGALIELSINTGKIYSTVYSLGNCVAGGITANLEAGGTIRQAYNTGTIEAGESHFQSLLQTTDAAGVAALSAGAITDCYNAGYVNATASTSPFAGGIISEPTAGASVSSCHNVGEISTNLPEGFAGGITAVDDINSVGNSYWLSTTGNNGIGTSLLLSDMKSQPSFAGFDFTDTWSIDAEASFPVPYLTKLGLPIYDDNKVEFVSGNGSLFDPFQISTLDQLSNVRLYPSSHYVLLNDIVCAPEMFRNFGKYFNFGYGWKPIEGPFIGFFDGGGHSISGLVINNFSATDAAGLFTAVGDGGIVKDLGIQKTSIHNTAGAGGFAGIVASGGLITGCYFTGTITATDAGGITSRVETGGSITNSFNTGAIRGSGYLGGVCGTNNGNLSQCYNVGNIVPTITQSVNAGGISGSSTGTIRSCYFLKGNGFNSLGTALAGTAYGIQSSFAGFDFTNTWSMNEQIKRPLLKTAQPMIHSVTYQLNGGSLPAGTPFYFMEGSAQNLPLPVRSGYTFAGWYGDAACTGTSVGAIPEQCASAVSYYAKWRAPISSAVSVGYTSIKVSWDGAGNATAYRIYRATSPTGTYALVYTAPSTARSWGDTGLTTGKYYYYKVFPVVGGTAYVFSTYKASKPIPATPSITVTKKSTSSAQVAWYGVAGATGYEIYRATSPSGTYTLVYTAASTSRSWTNTGLTHGKSYYYKVLAWHLEGSVKVRGVFSPVKYVSL